MNASNQFRLGGLALAGLLVALGLVRPEDSYLSDSLSLFNFSEMNPGDSAPAEEGVKPLLRGPVHEAYASLATVSPQPGPVAPKEPPALLKETPPADKPAGNNVQWVPGYWAWDDEGNNYLWVSGLWRALPPDRQWVPGHWHQLDGNQGWQWVSGLWGSVEQEQVKVLPPPPAPKEEEPGTAPSEDNLFAPGCWVYRDTGYEWRDGYWYTAEPDWVLVPAHYVWTPAGYVFVDDYWDYSLRNRGLLFAPVQIDEEVRKRGDWSYEPKHVVDDQCLLGALFTRPSLGWYYFGDFFDPRYDALGFFSWIFQGGNLRARGHAYDPLFQWYRFQNRKDVNWERQLRALYVGRRKDIVPRPPGDLQQQANLIRSVQNAKGAAGSALTRFGLLVGPLQKTDRRVINLKGIGKEGQGEARKAAEKLQGAGDQRAQQHARLIQEGKAPLKSNAAPQSLKLDLPKGPAVRGNANGQPPARINVRTTTTQLQKERIEKQQRAGNQLGPNPRADVPRANGPGAGGPVVNGQKPNGPGAGGPGAGNPRAGNPLPGGPKGNGPGAGGPVAGGPGAGNPKAGGPGANGPKVARPGANGPGVGNPRAGKQQAGGPKGNGPGAGGPGAGGPGAGNPKVSNPLAGGPRTNRPGAGGRGVNGPRANGSRTNSPGASGPRVGNPKGGNPLAGSPRVNGPGAGGPRAAGPGAGNPRGGNPQAGGPRANGPGAGNSRGNGPRVAGPGTGGPRAPAPRRPAAPPRPPAQPARPATPARPRTQPRPAAPARPRTQPRPVTQTRPRPTVVRPRQQPRPSPRPSRPAAQPHRR